MASPWDLIVIGGGSAGLVAAYTGAELGARVALVERHRTGGDCLWTGCVPSKALLSAAHDVSVARRVAGTSAGQVDVDFAAVMRHVRSAIATIEPVDSVEALEAAGVTVLGGEAVFTDASTVAVDGSKQRFHQAVLATGAEPVVPDIAGLLDSALLTTQTLWDVERLPARLVVIGGGPVGCELAQGFARLGSSVTLVETADRLLLREDPDAASLVQAALTRDGVDVRVAHRVVRVYGQPGGGPGDEPRYSGEVLMDDGRGTDTVAFDAILVATGRRARTSGLGLERAGVARTPAGAVEVDKYLRTTNPRVWAAGDVTPFPHLTHLASQHAGLATANALLGLRRRVDMSAVPRVVYTDPEVAAVGASTFAPSRAPQPRTVTRHHDHVDRAITDRRIDGFSRLTLSPNGARVVGATIVGPRAGESIAELTLVVRRRLRVTDLAATIHAYPTYADGPWNASVDELRRRLALPWAQRASRGWLAARRRWHQRRVG